MKSKKGQEADKSNFFHLCLATIGIVFGDIATSPLYAIRECFAHGHKLPINEINVLGVLSLVFWCLMLIVTLKYLFFVLRADNDGEGGVLALMTLAQKKLSSSGQRLMIITVGIMGCALLYGDGIITPAITVLGATEGLSIISSKWTHFVLPLTIFLLTGLFLIQKRGTAKIGMIFGPIISLWLITLFILGLISIIETPDVIKAINPYYGLNFLWTHRVDGLSVVGSVFLVVTGSEAMYADMGHLGRRPIRFVWIYLALPALLVNYFGQGALLLRTPVAVDHPFFGLAPDWFLIPLVILATITSIIASQALISGAFSITNQAIHLGYLPRMYVTHTSSKEIGQIYISTVNWLLYAGTILIVIEFKTSAALASAYGIAVSLTMMITTFLMFFVVRKLWKWSATKAWISIAAFLAVDFVFVYANMIKILDGGWVTLIVAIGIFVVMTTWYRGRRMLRKKVIDKTVGIKDLPKIIGDTGLHVIPGCGVFLSGQHISSPPALIQNLRFNRVIHETTVILTVETTNAPFLRAQDRIDVRQISPNVFLVVVKYGFKDNPNVPNALEWAKFKGVPIKDEVYYYMGRETVVLNKRIGIGIWRDFIFTFLSRNSQRATDFFRIPPNQVIEIGTQIEM